MREQYASHNASLIASAADVENLGTYEERIHHYENMNYTYIPMPSDERYYDTSEGWLRDIEPSQYITSDTHLLEVLERLREQPFLLVDADHNKFIVVRDSDKKPLLVTSQREITRRISAEEFKNNLNFKQYEFDAEDVSIYSIDDFTSSDMQLDVNQRALISNFDDRFQIITLADVNSRRMKDMLYQRLADLAAGLGKKIEEEYPESDEIFKYVQPEAIGRWTKDRIEGLNLHIAEHLNLIDMMRVIEASDKEFVISCGFESKNDVSVLNSINKIRNAVMHANRSLVHDRQDIGDVLEAVNEAERIVSNMKG